ncbi:MAG: HTTM domain-containing protein [Myxococcota bacterium]
MQALIDRWRAHLVHEGSTRAVALMRIGFVLLVWSRYADEILPFRHRGWDWWLLVPAFFVATTAMLFGVQTRLATVATACVLATMYGVFGWLGGHEPWVHHHTYLLNIGVVWLALTPCGRSFSVDRWRAVRHAEITGAEPPPERGPLWAVPLLAAQCSAVYLWSAVDKTNVRFLSGDQLESILMHFYSGSEPVSVPGFATVCLVASVFVVLVEYVLPVALFVRRWHPWVVLFAMLFHGVLYVAIPVGTFTLTMWVYFLAYVDPEAVHRFVDQLTGRPYATSGLTPR